MNAVGRLGRKPRLDRRQLGWLETALLEGPRRHGFATDLWTLPRVAMVIARLTGVHYHPGHIGYLLRGLQWSLQRPARRARFYFQTRPGSYTDVALIAFLRQLKRHFRAGACRSLGRAWRPQEPSHAGLREPTARLADR